jgi:hypothetical protein
MVIPAIPYGSNLSARQHVCVSTAPPPSPPADPTNASAQISAASATGDASELSNQHPRTSTADASTPWSRTSTGRSAKLPSFSGPTPRSAKLFPTNRRAHSHLRWSARRASLNIPPLVLAVSAGRHSRGDRPSDQVRLYAPREDVTEMTRVVAVRPDSVAAFYRHRPEDPSAQLPVADVSSLSH